MKRKAAGLEVYESTGEKEAPTILLFHGYGANGMDIAPVCGIDPKFNWFFPTGPIKVPQADRGWFPLNIEALKRAFEEKNSEIVTEAFPEELSQARELGERLIAELNIPLSKLFIGGFSQGAVLATEIALNLPEKPAGLLLFSGTLINEEKWKSLARKCAGMPFFQTHGKDGPILPLNRAEALEQLFLEAGLKGHLQRFSGGHEIPPSSFADLHKFLLNHG